MQRPARAEPLDGSSKYEKVRDLNSGTFGFVQLARDKTTGEYAAIKFIERGEKITKYVEREIVNHRCLVHPHIVQFKEVFLTSQYLCISMEFASGGDMFEYVVRKNGLREDEARWFFQQLIVGLDYCHRMGVVNRDIKLENTLLDSSPRPLVKICDFGYSKHEKFQSAPGSRVGTPAYLAPEVILTVKGKKYDGKIADIWSCGVMLYVMLVGAYPFERPEDKTDPQKLQKMIQRILSVDYHVPSHVRISDDCRDLLKRILVSDPTKRIGVEGIYGHPWYNKLLPPGVREMNDRPQPEPEGLQVGERPAGPTHDPEPESPASPPGPEPPSPPPPADATASRPAAAAAAADGPAAASGWLPRLSKRLRTITSKKRASKAGKLEAQQQQPASPSPLPRPPARPALQSLEDITRIVEEARRVAPGGQYGYPPETDDYIDGVMAYDSSNLEYDQA